MKAQASSQVFIYIMAAIVAGVILLVGYWAISTILAVDPDLRMAELQSEIETEISRTARQYGSVKKFEFTLDNAYDQICFVDSMDESTGTFPVNLLSTNNRSAFPFIANKIDTDIEENIFILDEKVVKETYYLEKLDVRDDFLCLENRGVLEVWLKGTGRVAEMYIPDP